MSAPVLVLVGPPGAGKSTVGRLLADRLGVPFRDTDADVVEVAGKPIAEVFIDDGEEHFRALESAAVLRALAEHSGVLSLGGERCSARRRGPRWPATGWPCSRSTSPPQRGGWV
jgi:shikimate kinase